MTSFDLDALAALGASVPPTDEWARTQASRRARQPTHLTAPAGSLGRLEGLSIWLAGTQGSCPPRPIRAPRLVIFAGDHGVAHTGVSAYRPEATAQMLRRLLAGDAAVSAVADLVGASVRAVDLAVDADLDDLPAEVTAYKVRRGSGDIATGPALTRGEAERAFAVGIAVADDEVDRGADLLITGEIGVGHTTAAAAVVAVLTGADVASVVGRGSGIDDRAWMIKCAAVRDAARRGRTKATDPVALLAEVAGADLAALSGFVLQAAVRRTPVVLDGVACAAAALVAHRIGPRSAQWWLAGHLSGEPAHRLAVEALQLDPVVDFGIRLGDGTGALLALPVLRAAGYTLAQPVVVDQPAARWGHPDARPTSGGVGTEDRAR